MKRKLNNFSTVIPWDGPPVAILWDQSLVWGLLCIETLSAAGIPLRLLSASEVHAGDLNAFRILLVPGGWAAHKVRTLAETGRKRIADFIEDGGSYIGFCGGAGLALSSPPALFLTPIERMPLSERLPSASGRIFVSGSPTHPCWENIPPEIPVSVWWPSQFRLKPGTEAICLAAYSAPGDGFQVADLRVSDICGEGAWAELEKTYGINLDPQRIKGHPAIIEVPKGDGRLILSYAHLETPGDLLGNRLLFNILRYLNTRATGVEKSCRPLKSSMGEAPDEQTWTSIMKAREAASGLIAFGEANLLWNWRKPWLLNWRRGIRGLEYGTLSVSLDYMVSLKEKLQGQTGRSGSWAERAGGLEQNTLEFCSLAKRLLLEEKIATQTAIVSKLGKVNERVDPLRGALFGSKMNHGGLSRILFDLIDGMLLDLMRLV
ncbi:MAG: BPL-N domain-containing protein [Syntrophobacteraceae bacterium]